MKTILYTIAIGVLLLSACTENRTTAETEKADTVTITDTVRIVKDRDDNSAAVSKDRLIVPGNHIAKVKLLDDFDNVLELLGTPDDGDAAMGKAWQIWYSTSGNEKNSLSVYTVRNYGEENPKAIVKLIRVTSGFFRTEEGLHTGSSLEEIEAVYRQLGKREDYKTLASGNVTLYDALDEGIAFEIDRNGICRAIIVHEKGQAFNMYLPAQHEARRS